MNGTSGKWVVFRAMTLSMLLVALTACETTGNPREGGLFGWSRKKADERQMELEQADADARNRVSNEQHKERELLGTQGKLSVEQARLQGEVERLLAENTQLEGRITDLMTHKQLGDKEVARLGEVLRQNRQLRDSLKAAPAGAASDSRAGTINAQNDALHREILALLKR